MAQRRFNYEDDTIRTGDVTELYIRGNVLPAPALPEREPAVPAKTPAAAPQREKRPDRLVRRNRQSITALTPLMLVFMGIMAALMFTAVLGLITVTGQITGYEKELTRVTSQFNALRADNNALQANMEKSVDLKEVYEIAVGEYGMTYPQGSQIVYYRQNKGSYVIQNEEIPTD